MKKFLSIVAVMLCIISCSDIKEDIDELQDKVERLEVQLELLQKAHQEGKFIKEVTPYSDGESSGWSILFTDGSSIKVSDIESAVTPLLSLDADGYWMVSYDNGDTFEYILDNAGEKILGRGKEPLSIRVAVNGEGNYIFESFYGSDPENVVSTIETSISSEPGKTISYIEKDPYSGTITLSMGDGTAYQFNLDVNFPVSIVVLAESVVLPKGGESSFEFRVNPSNAVVDLNLEQEQPMFELDMAVASMPRSYVTASSNYILEKIEAAVDGEGNVKEGQFVAHIRDLSVSDDYCEGAAVVVNSRDGKNNPVQISSGLFKIKSPDKPQFTTFKINGAFASDLEKRFISVSLPYGTDVTSLSAEFVASEGIVTVDGKEVKSLSKIDFSSPVEFTITAGDGTSESYYVSISYSRLPVVYINTKNGAAVTSKENWLKETEIYVTNAGDMSRLYSKSQIRGRGNTTWNYPKKPYAIKLDSKESVLGMPKHKRWVLLANYVDKTCIRNSVAFEIARCSEGLEWTPRGNHVDVVLNGKFMGNYFLCEQIKGDKNRVDITEMETSDITPETITGGYLLEIDKNFDEVNKFRSPVRNMPFMIKEPDEETMGQEQFNYIQNHIAEIENALYGAGSTTEGYLQYIDLDSFIDYWLVYELTGTGEPTHPKSVYMYKDRGGKIFAGPVWDFDYFTFQPYYNNWLINTNAVWNDRIINDPANRTAIKERWNLNREGYRAIAEEIDRQAEYVKESAEYNATIWPLDLNVNRDDALPVSEAVARMRGYYVTKFNYMDNYINSNY